MQLEHEQSIALNYKEDSQQEIIAESGRECLADRLTGREEAAIKIQVRSSGNKGAGHVQQTGMGRAEAATKIQVRGSGREVARHAQHTG